MDAASYRAHMRRTLGDTNGARYSDELLDEALRWALAVYSQANPQVMRTVLTLPGAGREHSLAALEGLSAVLEVYYPHREGLEPPRCESWRCYTRQAGLWLYLESSRIPTAGEGVLLVYTARHSIAGLDTAGQSSLPPADEYLFSNGAAGKAAQNRGLYLIEAYGSRSAEAGKLQAWAEARIGEFMSGLNGLKTAQSLPGDRPAGWRLDEWDHRTAS